MSLLRVDDMVHLLDVVGVHGGGVGLRPRDDLLSERGHSFVVTELAVESGVSGEKTEDLHV